MWAEHELIPFARGFHFQPMPAFFDKQSRLVQHLVDLGVVVIWVMVKQNKFFHLRVARQRHCAPERAVAPADTSFVFAVGVLGVENQDVAASEKFDESRSLLPRVFSGLGRT